MMKNINILPLSDESKQRLCEYARLYRQQNIHIEIKKINRCRIIVWVEQKECTNNNALTKKELEVRVRDMFVDELPDNLKLTVSAVNYDIREIGRVDSEWLRYQMERLGFRVKDIANRTGLDISTLSLLISGDKNMSKPMQIAMYYMFKYYETRHFENKRGCSR